MITLEIKINGKEYLEIVALPEIFHVSSGPMSMHSCTIQPVSAALYELCSQLWQERCAAGHSGGSFPPP